MNYGSWPSPISAASLVAGAVGIAEVVPDADDVWWVESRPDEGGRSALMRWRVGVTTEVTPSEANVRTLAHEYGGGAWWVHDGVALYVDLSDQRLRRITVGEHGDEAPTLLTPEPSVPRGLRYADGRVLPDGAWYVCVREDHTRGTAEAVNELVAVATDGSMRIELLATGADFYSCPRPSPDGTQLAWVQWNHPNMPWDDTELWLADLDGGAVTNARRIQGGGAESIWQPEWNAAGELHYLSDRSDLWWLYRQGQDDPVMSGAEIVCPGWVFGLSRYAFGPDDVPVAITSTDGVELLSVAPTLTMVNGIRLGGGELVWSGASWAHETEIWRGETLVRPARDHGVPDGFLPPPESIRFATTDGDVAHAIYYAPANPNVVPPTDELPPLLVLAHGGPTSAARSQLDLAKRYWTSRGIAVVDVNYRGSVGYGRAYRNKLRGAWGVADVADCVAAARYLANRGSVDGERLLIKGGSAGGFTVLSALVYFDDFAAGASRYGVADLEALATDTHKFESRYLDLLIGPYPEAREVYVERSPINHVDKLSAPMIVLQGNEDEVVPPNQSRMIVAALEAKGVRVEYLEFEGEQHGFRKSENIITALEAELSFFGKVLGFTPAEDL